jgi:hypothetical protein
MPWAVLPAFQVIVPVPVVFTDGTGATISDAGAYKNKCHRRTVLDAKGTAVPGKPCHSK